MNPFEPRMPEVDAPPDADLGQVFRLARFAAIGEELPETAPRKVALVTPGRMLVTYNCPKPGSIPDEPPVLASARRNIAVIAYTEHRAVTADVTKAVPFFGMLMSYAYIGHAVWLFEGHPSAIEAGCRDADSLIVDSGMLPYLDAGWQEVAAKVMRHAVIAVHERESFSLRPLSPERAMIDRLLSGAADLIEAGRVEEAITAYDEVESQFGHCPGPGVAGPLAMALHNKGLALTQLGRVEEGVAAFGEVAVRYGDRTELEALSEVARALRSKGRALEELGQLEEAIAANEEAIAVVGDRTDPAAVELLADAQYNKGVDLQRMGRFEEAIRSYDRAERQSRGCTQPVVIQLAARAISNKGAALKELGRLDEAVAVYDEFLAQFGERADPAMAYQLAVALYNKGGALKGLGRFEEAIRSYDMAERQIQACPEPDVFNISSRARAAAEDASRELSGSGGARRKKRIRRARRGPTQTPN